MRVYVDVCCLKRPFDAQDRLLVRLETEAVMTILSAPPLRVTLVRTPAQIPENKPQPRTLAARSGGRMALPGKY